MDSSDITGTSRRRILITLGRAGLVDLSGDRTQMIGRSEAEMILESSVIQGDPLLGMAMERGTQATGQTPWIRIKDRFRGHENGSILRKSSQASYVMLWKVMVV